MSIASRYRRNSIGLSSITGLRRVMSFVATSIILQALHGFLDCAQPDSAGAEPRSLGERSARSAAPRVSAHGRVVDARGEPIAGATVVIRDAVRSRRSEDDWTSPPDDILAWTQTDAQGYFELRGVVAYPSQDDLAAKFRRTPWDVIVRVNGFALAWKALARPDDSEPLNFSLESEATLVGRVVDEQARPAVGVMVRLTAIAGLPHDSSIDESPMPAYNFRDSPLGIVGRADDAGRFAVSGLPKERAIALTFEDDTHALETVYAATTDTPQPDYERPIMSDWRFAYELNPHPRAGTLLCCATLGRCAVTRMAASK